jgi:predicted nucleic-acid-binding protein
LRGIDTNLLIRLATHDDPAQTAVVEDLLMAAERSGERFHVSTVVLCELAWALRGGRYRLRRLDIAEVLGTILQIEVFEVQDRHLVDRALAQYRQGAGDFADYLISWLDGEAGCSETLTFDSDLSGSPRFHVLSA